jgi:hypothetical protein
MLAVRGQISLYARNVIIVLREFVVTQHKGLEGRTCAVST